PGSAQGPHPTSTSPPIPTDDPALRWDRAGGLVGIGGAERGGGGLAPIRFTHRHLLFKRYWPLRSPAPARTLCQFPFASLEPDRPSVNLLLPAELTALQTTQFVFIINLL